MGKAEVCAFLNDTDPQQDNLAHMPLSTNRLRVKPFSKTLSNHLPPSRPPLDSLPRRWITSKLNSRLICVWLHVFARGKRASSSRNKTNSPLVVWLLAAVRSLFSPLFPISFARSPPRSRNGYRCLGGASPQLDVSTVTLTNCSEASRGANVTFRQLGSRPRFFFHRHQAQRTYAMARDSFLRCNSLYS